jgi:hypothetical protein
VGGSMPIVDQGEAFVRNAALMELAATDADDDAVEDVVLLMLLELLLVVDEVEGGFTAVLGL